MTALANFPVTDTPDPRDPASVAAVVRELDITELSVALHVSGAKLLRSTGQDIEMLVSLAEIGTAAVGADEVRARARRSLEIVFDPDADDEYKRLVGGPRRAQLCCDFAHRLYAHFGHLRPDSPDVLEPYTLTYEYRPGSVRWTGIAYPHPSYPGDPAAYLRP